MIGQRHHLRVLREQPCGVFLDALDLGEILLPRREMPKIWEIGANLDVFIYRDSEDRLVATLKHPKITPGQFAYLEAREITHVGAFLDWGLPKDLLLPFREQKDSITPGRSYVVRCLIDEETGRLIASQRLARFLDLTPPPYKIGDQVQLTLYGKTDLGYKAIINSLHTGLIYHNQVFRRLRAGENTTGYIADLRPDGKIDLSLTPPGREKISQLEQLILTEIEKRGNFWEIHDRSPAEFIYQQLGTSKRSFKQATGSLFKKHLIRIDPNGLHLLPQKPTTPPIP